MATITASQFAQKIKTKYPQYQNVNDDVLVHAMIKKYPQYASRISDLHPETVNSAGSEQNSDQPPAPQAPASPAPQNGDFVPTVSESNAIPSSPIRLNQSQPNPTAPSLDFSATPPAPSFTPTPDVPFDAAAANASSVMNKKPASRITTPPSTAAYGPQRFAENAKAVLDDTDKGVMGTIAKYTTEPIVNSAGNALLRTGATIYREGQAIGRLFKGEGGNAGRDLTSPVGDDVKTVPGTTTPITRPPTQPNPQDSLAPLSNLREFMGAGVTLGSTAAMFVGGAEGKGAVGVAKNMLARRAGAMKAGALTGAFLGGTGALGPALMDTQKTPVEVAGETALGTLFGTALGMGTGAISSGGGAVVENITAKRANAAAEREFVDTLSQEAQKVYQHGGSKPLIEMVKSSSPEDRVAYLDMIKSAEKAKSTLAPTSERPPQRAGQTIMDYVNYINKVRKSAGQAVDANVKAMGDAPLSLNRESEAFTGMLADKGIKIGDGGQLDFTDSALSGKVGSDDRAILQHIYDKLRPDENGNVRMTPQQLRTLRQSIFNDLKLGANKNTITTEMKNVAGNVYDALSEPLKARSPQYAKAAQTYAETQDAIKNFSDAIGHQWDFSDDGIKSLRAAEVGNRVLGNASARPIDMLNRLTETAKKYGYSGEASPLNQIAFADHLEELLGTTQSRSLEGGVARGTAAALNKASAAHEIVTGGKPISTALRKVIDYGAEAPESLKVKALQEFIKSEGTVVRPPNHMPPDFTIPPEAPPLGLPGPQGPAGGPRIGSGPTINMPPTGESGLRVGRDMPSGRMGKLPDEPQAPGNYAPVQVPETRGLPAPQQPMGKNDLLDAFRNGQKTNVLPPNSVPIPGEAPNTVLGRKLASDALIRRPPPQPENVIEGKIVEEAPTDIVPKNSKYKKLSPEEMTALKASNLSEVGLIKDAKTDKYYLVDRTSKLDKVEDTPEPIIHTGQAFDTFEEALDQAKLRNKHAIDLIETTQRMSHPDYNFMTGKIEPKAASAITDKTLLQEAKKYKTAAEFEKSNNPVESFLETDGDEKRVVLDLFPNDLVRSKGITKNYTLDRLKDAYEQDHDIIEPSNGLWTRQGDGFIKNLEKEGYVKEIEPRGQIQRYQITDKINDWKIKNQLTEIWNQANQKPKIKRPPKK